MPDQLTPRQRELLGAIQYNIKANGYPPTVRELQRQGFGSLGNVHQLLSYLEKKGYIFRKKRGGSRAIEILTGSETKPVKVRPVPVLGDPMAFQSNVAEELLLDAKLTGEGEVFAIRINTQPVQDAGLRPGDLVIFERCHGVRDGHLMLIALNGNLLVKRLVAEPGRTVLQSENPLYQPIYVKSDEKNFSVIGLVRAVIRKY